MFFAQRGRYTFSSLSIVFIHFVQGTEQNPFTVRLYSCGGQWPLPWKRRTLF